MEHVAYTLRCVSTFDNQLTERRCSSSHCLAGVCAALPQAPSLSGETRNVLYGEATKSAQTQRQSAFVVVALYKEYNKTAAKSKQE